MKAFLGACVLLCCFGCVMPDKATMTSLDDSWALLKPYTVAGIEADTTITPETKVLRKRLVAEFTATIQQGVKNGR
jgi:hypothetical protein